ncbi:hypothetical protein CSUI_011065, partial [Cystoisospora suis]
EEDKKKKDERRMDKAISRISSSDSIGLITACGMYYVWLPRKRMESDG